MSFTGFPHRDRPYENFTNEHKLPIKVYSANVNSLRDKKEELSCRVNAHLRKPHIVCVQETKLDENITDKEVAIDGYKIYRKDRNKKGGGVAIYVRDDVKVMDIRKSSDPDIEGIGVLILHDGLYIPCFCLYRPPKKINKYEFLIRTFLFLHSCNCSPLTDNIVAGDFNISINDESSVEREALIFFSFFMFLKPGITKETHQKRSIDQILCPLDARPTVCTFDEYLLDPYDMHALQEEPIEKKHTPVIIEFTLPIRKKRKNSDDSDYILKRRLFLCYHSMVENIKLQRTLNSFEEELIINFSNIIEKYHKFKTQDVENYSCTALIHELETIQLSNRPIQPSKAVPLYIPSKSSNCWNTSKTYGTQSNELPQRRTPVPTRQLSKEENKNKLEKIDYWDERNKNTVVRTKLSKPVALAGAGALAGATAGAAAGAKGGACAGPHGMLVGAAAGALIGMMLDTNGSRAPVLDASITTRCADNKEQFKAGVTTDVKLLNCIEASVGPSINAKIKDTDDKKQLKVGLTADGKLFNCIEASVGPTVKAGAKHTKDETGVNAGIELANASVGGIVNASVAPVIKAGVKHTEDEVGINVGLKVAKANIGKVVNASVAPSVNVGVQGGNGAAIKADLDVAQANVGPVNVDAKLSATTGIYEENGVVNAKFLGTGASMSKSYIGISVLGFEIGFGKK